MDARAGRPWEWSPEQIRQLGYRVVDLISEHLTNLPQGPVFRPFPQDLVDQLRSTPPPQTGQDPETILPTSPPRSPPIPWATAIPASGDNSIPRRRFLASSPRHSPPR
jgi:hypothetical protein